MSDDSTAAETAGRPAKKILLVDDDREIVESMRIALDAIGLSRSSSPATATRGWRWSSGGSGPGDSRHDDAQAERLSGAGEAPPHAPVPMR